MFGLVIVLLFSALAFAEETKQKTDEGNRIAKRMSFKR